MLPLFDKSWAAKLVVFPNRIPIKIINDKIPLFLKSSNFLSATDQDELFQSQNVEMTAEFFKNPYRNFCRKNRRLHLR